MPGSHEYKGRLYLPFMPPSIIEAASNFPATKGDVIFGTYPRAGIYGVFILAASQSFSLTCVNITGQGELPNFICFQSLALVMPIMHH